MKNRVCLITGANAGIGRETALALAKQGARVIMLCRNLPKALAAQQAIIQESANQQVDIVICDLSNLDDVKRAAEEIKQRYPQIHVLVNNAGFMVLDQQNTCNNFESTFAVNYLAHVLLTELLLDTMKNSAPSRVIHVSSSVHKRAKLDLADPMFKNKPYKGFVAYANSKLANILYSNLLAERLQGSGVTSNALDPGMVDTEFGDKVGIPAWMRIFTSVLRPWVKTPPEGALTSIYLASAPEIEQVTGTYWAKATKSECAVPCHDKKLQQALWHSTRSLLKPWL